MSDRLSNALFVATGYTAIAVLVVSIGLLLAVAFILLALAGTWGVVASVFLLIALMIGVGTAYIYNVETGDDM